MSKPIYTNSPYATNTHEFSGFNSAQSTGGWSSLSAKRTTSFTDIHQEVFNTVSHPYKAYNPANIANEALFAEQYSESSAGRGDQPDGDATGEVPVGDMLIPILLIALGYFVIKLFRNHKTSRAL